MIKLLKYLLISLVIIMFVWVLPSEAQKWRPVGSGIINNISGIALIEQQDKIASFLVVHDNKKPKEQRVGWLMVKGEDSPIYRKVKWQSNNLPNDLEAITTIPEKSNQFLALSSHGEVYHLQLTDDHQSVKILKGFKIPHISHKNNNFEGLSLQNVDGVLIIAWAHRGNNEQPGLLYWSQFDLESDNFLNPIQSLPLVMPLKGKNVRHVSDLKIDSSGAMFVTSTVDSGDNGPFTSAFYLAGTFQFQKEKITFLRSKNPIPLLHFKYHKIEAVEFLSGEKGGLIFGTDDENFGSSLYLTW